MICAAGKSGVAVKQPRVALYEFMPYGAPELLEDGDKHLTRAMATAMTGMLALLALGFGLSTWFAHHPIAPLADPGHVVTFEPPPSIEVPLLPQGAAPAPATPLVARVPLPVPDATAPLEPAMPSQAQLSREGPATAPGAGPGTAPPPAVTPVLPGLGTWIYFDEPPAVVTQVKPEYTDLAREAGVEGTVVMRALVGTDGHVKDVHVDKSVPLLDEAAVSAVRKWVFTPALSSGHPVAVWVSVPVRFNLH